MSEEHKIIAVYGNGGSYKTTTAIQLALALHSLDNSADIVVVGLDSTKPILPVVFPNSGSNIKVSLGKLMAEPTFDQDTITANIHYPERIGFLGYNIRENINTYAKPIDSRMDDFFMQMRHLVNYTVVDCTSDVINDKFTAKAVINADIVVELLSNDINGLVFDGSQEGILQSEQYGYHGFIRCLTESNRARQDKAATLNAIDRISFTIPCSNHIAEQMLQGRLTERCDDGAYTKVITQLAKAVTEA